MSAVAVISYAKYKSFAVQMHQMQVQYNYLFAFVALPNFRTYMISINEIQAMYENKQEKHCYLENEKEMQKNHVTLITPLHSSTVSLNKLKILHLLHRLKCFH